MCSQIKVIVTGTNGFIGSRLLALSDESKFELIPISLQTTNVRDIDFKGVDAIIHLAGIAGKKNIIQENEMMQVNSELTRKLAEAAKQSSVKHFVFMSTVKVYGDDFDFIDESTAYSSKKDIYGKSKLLAEKGLLELINADFIVSILRPPIVYGPNVKGNILRLLKLSDSRLFLPFGSIENKRSMVFIDNLIGFIFSVLENPKSDIFLVSDLEAVSTTHLISTIRENLGQRPRLWRIPSVFLKVLEKLNLPIYKQLFGSLEVQTDYSFKVVDYTPRYSFEEGMKMTIDWYKSINVEGK